MNNFCFGWNECVHRLAECFCFSIHDCTNVSLVLRRGWQFGLYTIKCIFLHAKDSIFWEKEIVSTLQCFNFISNVCSFFSMIFFFHCLIVSYNWKSIKSQQYFVCSWSLFKILLHHTLASVMFLHVLWPQMIWYWWLKFWRRAVCRWSFCSLLLVGFDYPLTRNCKN